MINRHFIFICLICILILVLYFVSLENNKEYFGLFKFMARMESLGTPASKNWVASKTAGFVNYNIAITDLKFYDNDKKEITYLNYYLKQNKDKNNLPFCKFKIRVLFNPINLGGHIMSKFITNENDKPLNINSLLNISFKRNAPPSLATTLSIEDLYSNSYFEVDDKIHKEQYSYKEGTFKLNNNQSQHYILNHIFIYRNGIDYHKYGNHIIGGNEDKLSDNHYPRLNELLDKRFKEEYDKRDSLLEQLNIENNNIDIFSNYSIEIDRNYTNLDDKYTKIKFEIKQELKEDIKKAIKRHNSSATDMFDYNNYRVKLLYNYRNSNTIDFVSNNFTIKDIDRSFDYKNNYTGEEIKEDIIKNNLVYPKEIKIVDEKNPVDWNIPYDLNNKKTHGHRKTTNKHRSKYFKEINITRMGYNTMDIEVLISQDLMLALDTASRKSRDGNGYDNNKITFDWKDDKSKNIVKADTKITINDADDLKKIGILKFKNIKTDTKFNHIFIYKKSNYKMWDFIIKYKNDPELKNCLNILNISNIQRTNIKTKINTEFKNIFTESFPETIKYYQKTKEYENSYFTIQEVTCIYDIENIEVFRPSGSNSKRDNNLKYYPFKIILKPNEQLKKAIEQHTTPQKDLIMKYNMGKPLLIKFNSEVILEKPVIITKDNYTFYIKIDKILIQKTPNYINSINILLDNYSGTYLHKKWVTFQIVNGGYNFINDKYTKELFCSINKKICVEINRVKYPSNTKFKDNECYYPCKGYLGCLDTPSKICK